MTVDSFDDIKRPGTMFKWGEHEFVSDGVTENELNVIRLSNFVSRDQLYIDPLKEHIADGDVELIDTHTESQVAVPEDELSIVLAFLADDPTLDGHYPKDSRVAAAMLAVENAVPEGSHWFRYRDE